MNSKEYNKEDIFNSIEMLVETRSVDVKINGFDDVLNFRALTTTDLFILFNEYPEFINYIFSGVNFKDREEFKKKVFSKYPRVMSLILAMTVIHNEKDLIKKSKVFESMNVEFQLESFKNVIELTFKSGVSETIKKLENNLVQILETFQEAKTEVKKLNL